MHLSIVYQSIQNEPFLRKDYVYMSKPQVIAFYLPQFYPTKENDEWWQKGFTEWTNVGKAKPLFKGHYQPRVPADLGYYDLRLPEVREQQAELAHEAGIDGFCYWHYWFAGRRLLDRVFTEVVESGKPDFPFCLCWANHSWYQKTWDPSKPDKLLIEQTYPGEEDYVNHFKAMLPAFKDSRYIKTDGKLNFGIFGADKIPSFPLMKEIWNDLATKNGLPEFFFWGLAQGRKRLLDVKNMDYDGIIYDNLQTVYDQSFSFARRAYDKIFNRPHVIDYQEYVKMSVSFFEEHKDLFPCIMPNFDHSPRSMTRGVILHRDTPQKWEKFFQEVYHMQSQKNNSMIIIKSWNEWGEGNYLEPDLKFGKQYLEAIKKVINPSNF